MGKMIKTNDFRAGAADFATVARRWWDTEVEGVMCDTEGNLLVADSVLRFGADVASKIEATRAAGKQVKFDDLNMFATEVDGVFIDEEGNLFVEDSALKSDNKVAKLLRKAYKDRRNVVYGDQQPPKKGSNPGSKAVTPKAPVTPAPAAAQAAPVVATAASAPAEEVVVPTSTASAEPVQDAPTIDEPPALPAAPVASAQEVPKAKKAFRSYWTAIVGLWVLMVAILAISWPVAVILAWAVAVAGFWFVGRNVYRFAPNWSPFIAIGWVAVTLWWALPTTSFMAKFMLPYYSAQAVVPATWLATATLIWLGFVFKSIIGKGISGAWKRRKKAIPFVKAVRAEPRLLKTKAAQIWAAIKAAWKEKYPN